MMKKIKLLIAGSLLIAGLAIVQSCTKEAKTVTSQTTDFSKSSLVQVYMAMVNASRNSVYVDANAITGATMSTGAVFPSSSYASSIAPGIKTFLVRDTLSTTTQVPLTFAENMELGKNYTIFVYDTITSPKQKTVQTLIQVPTDTTCRLRFANFVYNPTAVPNVDVFSFRRNANVFTNIPVTGVTDYIPYASGVVDTLYVRETGTLNQYVKVPVGSFTQKRSYTAIFRGSFRATSRTVSVFANY